ncbi:11685_t:CDS:1, partial [Scutellospora calospora]
MDNESAMVVCRRLIAQKLQTEFNNIRFLYYRYATHVLNLATKKGLEIVDFLVNKVWNLMAKIKLSICLSNDLCSLYELKGILYLKPKLDIKT